MTDAPKRILWCEGDVRDAMAEFDPAAKDWSATPWHVGVYGRREFGVGRFVAVFAYWTVSEAYPVPPSTVYASGSNVYDGTTFDDPLDAIFFALAELARAKAVEGSKCECETASVGPRIAQS